jgi:hypothetical protein
MWTERASEPLGKEVKPSLANVGEAEPWMYTEKCSMRNEDLRYERTNSVDQVEGNKEGIRIIN